MVAARVLIVEDEEAQARALKAHLEFEGHQVTVAGDGVAAVRHVDRGLDLILCDLRLPDMDGLEIFRRVRESLGDDAPSFVILTAYGTVESARAALKSGVYDYLTKPIDPTEVSFLLKNVLDQRQLRRENRELSRAMGKAPISERLIGESKPFREMVELAK